MNLTIQSFPTAVKQQINYYVYRLIDPRNGETFYVGKGKDDRIFSHIKAAINNINASQATELLNDSTEDDLDETDYKLRIIRDICNAGMDIILIIHRHGMTEDQAFEVEAALIDAYPGTANIVGGFGCNDRGVMNVSQIINKYNLNPVEIWLHNCLLICVTDESIQNRGSIYNAVRYAWRLNKNRAEAVDYVLAVKQGIIIGVFKPERWLDATAANFPDFPRVDKDNGRIGFKGRKIGDIETVGDIEKLHDSEILSIYLNKLAPSRKKGAATPVRYIDKDK
jgi:uncharacterized protein